MDALAKIHEFERFGSILGLERMSVLMDKLGNPQENLKVIHVAGTNGKGSICKYIYEVLQTGGYKTGLYTSPFLEKFNERIEFDGEYISNDDLEKYTEKVLVKSKEMVIEGKESPTEFEIVTAIAFLYFSDKKCDYVVLEVGLGGRGDSTNLIKKPLISIIASISLDHTDRLGNTISQIAFEKAGIIKEGCPVVISTDKEEAKKVFFKRASELNASLYNIANLQCNVRQMTLESSIFDVEIENRSYNIEISMIGRHQIQNALTALYALDIMRREKKVILTEEQIKVGFRKAKQIGRFEIMSTAPYIIIDGAHNPDGAKALKDVVQKEFENENILMVVGILSDKAVDDVISNFLQITKKFVVCEPDNPRRMAAEELKEKITTKGGTCIIIKEPSETVKYVEKEQKNYDLILFAGSLYLIGEIRRLIRNGSQEKKSNSVL